MVSKPFQRPFSLATRLTFFISLATIAAFFAFAWIMIHSVKVHFAEQDINDLKEISATLERVLNHPDETQARRLMTLEDIVSGYSNVLISLADSHGKTVYHSPGAPDIREFTRDAIPDKDAQGGEVYLLSGPTIMMPGHGHGHMEHSNWRMINLPVGPLVDGKPIYTLYIALSIDFHLHYINDLMNKLIMTASVISILIVFIVLLAVHKGHAPIRSVSRQIQNITSKDLDVRLDPQTVPIELEQLVLSFNHMIERIEDVFTRQSNFSADIAHEIRTPITNLITQTEIALPAVLVDTEWKADAINLSPNDKFPIVSALLYSNMNTNAVPMTINNPVIVSTNLECNDNLVKNLFQVSFFILIFL